MSYHPMYYFGCFERPGHYMWSPLLGRADIIERRRLWALLDSNPWGTKIDGGLCPNNDKPFRRTIDEIEGQAIVHHKDGWTAISFWDRSVDTRGACNSNFLAQGTFTFPEMVALAQQHFPEVWARFTFPIVEVEP